MQSSLGGFYEQGKAGLIASSVEAAKSYVKHGIGFATAQKSFLEDETKVHQVGLQRTIPDADSRITFVLEMWTLVADHRRRHAGAHTTDNEDFATMALRKVQKQHETLQSRRGRIDT